MGINKSLSGHAPFGIGEMQALMSLVVSMLMCLLKLSEAAAFLSFAAVVRNKVDQGNAFNHPEWPRFHGAAWFVRFSCVLLMASIAYGVCKLIAAYMCEDAMWNLTGCVDLDEHHHK